MGLRAELSADRRLRTEDRQALQHAAGGRRDSARGRTPVGKKTVRTIYVIGPDKLVKAMIFYPMSAGRNFDEILRLIDSVQLTAKHVATPVNWKQGEDVVIVPAVLDAEAKDRFTEGRKASLPYMRVMPQPKS